MNFHPPVILKIGNMNLNLADKWIGHIPQRNFTVRPWTFIPGPKEKGSSGKTMIFYFCHSTFRGLIQISKSRFTKMGWDFQSTLKKKMQGFTLKFLGHDLKGIKAMTFFGCHFIQIPFPKPFTLHHLDLPNLVSSRANSIWGKVICQKKTPAINPSIRLYQWTLFSKLRFFFGYSGCFFWGSVQ